jgi:hypothetical protein
LLRLPPFVRMLRRLAQIMGPLFEGRPGETVDS